MDGLTGGPSSDRDGSLRRTLMEAAENAPNTDVLPLPDFGRRQGHRSQHRPRDRPQTMATGSSTPRLGQAGERSGRVNPLRGVVETLEFDVESVEMSPTRFADQGDRDPWLDNDPWRVHANENWSSHSSEAAMAGDGAGRWGNWESSSDRSSNYGSANDWAENWSYRSSWRSGGSDDSAWTMRSGWHDNWSYRSRPASRGGSWDDYAWDEWYDPNQRNLQPEVYEGPVDGRAHRSEQVQRPAEGHGDDGVRALQPEQELQPASPQAKEVRDGAGSNTGAQCSSGWLQKAKHFLWRCVDPGSCSSSVKELGRSCSTFLSRTCPASKDWT